jgi:hypothetical protein
MPTSDRLHSRVKGARAIGIAVLFGFIATPPVGLRGDAAAAAPGSRCATAKIRAVGKAVFDKAKCHRKAILDGTAVAPACLTKVQSRLTSAIAAADLLGPCPGTTGELSDDTDECIASFLSTSTPATSTTSTTIAATIESCCYGTSLCTQTYVATPGDCSVVGTMAAGAAGTVCGGTTGGCVDPPTTGGPCCQTTAIAGLSCLAGPSLNQQNCETLLGTFFASATCSPSGCVP